MTGRSIPASKPINLAQLQAEIVAAGTAVDSLGSDADTVYTYDAEGAIADFVAADQAAVDAAIAAHVAMRDKTDAELAEEFRAEGVTAARKQEIRDMQSGLAPREQVEVTQAEWDARMAPV